ncbi:hypothetical protein [Agromyces sp. Soil535]|uniref:hypothetical protein n=1 Tax=Agromyces sp. Soil535 TaxID=1736390 RepID=UPI0012E35053|nr:hypothetical protein [Agromyces sp. Soil535]
MADLMLRGRNMSAPPRVRKLHSITDTTLYFPPYEYECPSFSQLHARLLITEEVLVAWAFEEVAAETLLEELHTAVELVLEELVNRRSKRLSFAQLVGAATDAGHLQDSERDLVLALKDLRKEVRHRAANGARDWAEEHWEDVALCVEKLVARLNRNA